MTAVVCKADFEAIAGRHELLMQDAKEGAKPLVALMKQAAENVLKSDYSWRNVRLDYHLVQRAQSVVGKAPFNLPLHNQLYQQFEIQLTELKCSGDMIIFQEDQPDLAKYEPVFPRETLKQGTPSPSRYNN
jgi:hypothetical protein